ncbi:MAG: glycoside hydrolase family 15 protein [Parachlamydia sp.]|nr:glycoside hydrolase family 15 protein [Parachlamydia sp.]
MAEAPGKPGIEPRWTSSAKIGVGTAMSGASNVWFTISHGILNEVYYPRVDIANIRDFGLIVTGNSFFSEEKRHAVHEYATVEEGIPAFVLTNTCSEGRYRIEKIVFSDPCRNVLLQKIIFKPLKGKLEDYRLYFLLSPHINNMGKGNSGSAGKFKGYPMLFAERAGIYLSCSASAPLLAMSCGYVGVSDAWQDLSKHGALTQVYERANDGNIALAGEIDLKGCGGEFVLALGFAPTREEAGLQTRLALHHNVDAILEDYVKGWKRVQDRISDLGHVDEEGGRLFRTSMAVLKTHEGKQCSGSVIASLSIPWGFSKGDLDLGGYHLIWPRDQVQSSLASVATGDLTSARETLLFLMSAQEEDGHWMQCMWVDGSPYWTGLQLDETALPILLADLLQREGCLEGIDVWPMISKAALFLVKNGPATQQDRWEENEGLTPFTLASVIAALLVAADFFEQHGKGDGAKQLRLVADWWNESLERWLYVEKTPLSEKCQVGGYYVRIRPSLDDDVITIKNRPFETSQFPYSEIVSIDALALVRYGLRSAEDPRILNTIKVIDKLLKADTAKGSVWHRYNQDGYGEHADGAPFDGTGIGRGWPLLSGERAHYELAKGNKKGAVELLRDMARLAGVGGLIPEQIWDSPDIPARTLYNGHSAGSAKPLVWAHAEYVTLLRSLKEGRVFDMPPQTVQRYLKNNHSAPFAIWQMEDKVKTIPHGKGFRLHLKDAARVRWSSDDWKSYQDVESRLTGLGVHVVELPLQKLPAGSQISFTFFWLDSQRWEGRNYEITKM